MSSRNDLETHSFVSFVAVAPTSVELVEAVLQVVGIMASPFVLGALLSPLSWRRWPGFRRRSGDSPWQACEGAACTAPQPWALSWRCGTVVVVLVVLVVLVPIKTDETKPVRVVGREKVADADDDDDG